MHVYEAHTHPSFGELALMYSKPRAASVVSKKKGVLWALDRRAFREILLHRSSHETIVKVLHRVDVLHTLQLPKLQRLADILTEAEFADGDTIVQQGDEGNTFYVIQDGSVKCTVQDGATSREVMQLGQYDYFGERALLNNEPRAASVIAVGPVTCLHISRAAFEEVLGPLQTIIDTDRQRREQQAAAGSSHLKAAFFAQHDNSLAKFASCSLSDVRTVRVVHSLQCGQVAAAQFANDTRRTFTLKTYHKQTVRTTGQHLQVMRERHICESLLDLGESGNRTAVSNRFLPHLIATFQDECSLYSLTDCDVCLPVSSVMEEAGAMPENDLKFYVACAVEALEGLHQHHVLFRGLNPEMLMLNSQGYLVLNDFRLGKVISGGKTFTICGAPEFMAPEQVAHGGQGLGVDFWQLGVFIYDMLTGTESVTPFGDDSASELQLYNAISSHEYGSINIPDASPAVSMLINALLHPDPNERLGCSGRTATEAEAGMTTQHENIRRHGWFAGFKWDKLRKGKLTAPHRQLAAIGHDHVDVGQIGLQEPYNGDPSWFRGF